MSHTPYFHWFGKIPNLQHLRVFGCVAYLVKVVANRHKLDTHSTRMVFVGYANRFGVKAYRLYDPQQRNFHFSHSVYFDEVFLIRPQQGGNAVAPLSASNLSPTSKPISAGTGSPQVEWEEADQVASYAPPLLQLPSPPV
ncbi:hypothetical protein GOP47_0026917 [Adiantum capillus-veneris]|nr:hypothetical protein GOP47_0026917 [Adiantum capillus-veneris]